METPNKVALVTGGTSGIGIETVKGLAKEGYCVVLLARNKTKAAKCMLDIEKEVPGAQLFLIEADLSSFESIRRAAELFKKDFNHLNILVNNAGIWQTKFEASQDGIEKTFAVNHLAPFLLTNLLLDSLKAGSPARIINVSSMAHQMGKLNWLNLEGDKEGDFSGTKAYAQSKLCNILFTNALAKRLAGTSVTVNALHPGVIATGLYSNMSNLLKSAASLFFTSPEKGARTTMYLATSPDVEGISGSYFDTSKEKAPSKNALNDADAERLWQVSTQYTGLGVVEEVHAAV